MQQKVIIGRPSLTAHIINALLNIKLFMIITVLAVYNQLLELPEYLVAH